MKGPVVQVKEGALQGAVVDNIEGGSYISFLGIPYAEPPVGELRFQEPQPIKPWTGVRSALKEGPNCAQVNLILRKFKGEEDCLYLNVATASLDESRPVMVWIHEGGFVMGSGNINVYSPDYLLKKDVVYVSLNYRLGCLGFLNLEVEGASGNQALRDVVTALKWVKENIAVFGGDPNNVTIFGQSAGSAIVHYLTLSPLAKGLFHKAIAQSGLAICPWGFKADHLSIAYRLVAAFGLETSDPQEALSFLRSISASELIQTEFKLLLPHERLILTVPFGPSVDDKSPEPFIPRPPAELAAEGIDIPFILGYNADDGVIYHYGLDAKIYAEIDKRFESMVLSDLKAEASAMTPTIVKKIKELYFGDEPISTEQRDNFLRYIGDTHYINGVHQISAVQAQKNSQTYLYRYSYIGSLTLAPTWYNMHDPVTGHGDELAYLFHRPAIFRNTKIQNDTRDRIVLDRLTQMWTDFAKTGNPTPRVDDLITERWLPLTRTTKNYLEIGDDLVAGVNPGNEKWEAWQRIYDMM